MFKRQKSSEGFTMVELLIVLIIVGILAAVATPLYLTNVKRARASEAVSSMGLIRQAMRDHKIKTNTYFSVVKNTDEGNIQEAPTTGVSVDVGVTQYFSNGAYTVDAALNPATGKSGKFTNPNAVDFVIRVNGSVNEVEDFGENRACPTSATATNCALKADEVSDYLLEMDNSGRVFVSYGSKNVTTNGTTTAVRVWEAY